jgi:phytoene desaturase
MSVRRVVVVGAGFGGLTSALLLAKKGFEVTIVEKNSEPGGRARLWQEKGFTFELAPVGT